MANASPLEDDYPMSAICLSSGHGKHVAGASGYLDEVEQARKVVVKVAQLLRHRGITVKTFHDNTSTSQGENLDAIVDWHNNQDRELDVSIHFNAYETTDKPMGTEVLYLTQSDLANDVAETIAQAGGFINRGPKYRDDLAFLNGTDEPAILIEVCFVDSAADAELYQQHFDRICQAIADAIA